MPDLRSKLCTSIYEELVDELLDSYVTLKRKFQYRDQDGAISAASRYCESVLKCVLHLYDRRQFTKTGINFGNTMNEIMTRIPKPTSTIDELQFRGIPIAANGMYWVRNKKWGMHARGEDLTFIDLHYVVQASDWILACLLFVCYSGVDENTTLELMRDLIQFDVPLIEKVGEYSVFTYPEIGIGDALFVLLYTNGGNMSYAEVVRNLTLRFERTTLDQAISEGENNSQIFMNPETKIVTLLSPGRIAAEEIIRELEDT